MEADAVVFYIQAGMAELADAAALGAAGRKPLGVQIPLPAPRRTLQLGA